MKKSLTATSCWLLLFILLFSSCYKIDWLGGNQPPGKKYEVAECISSMYSPGHPYLFVKTYDGFKKYPSEINASFFNVRPPTDLVHFNLRIVNKGSWIYLINKDNPVDTSLFVKLNGNNRIESCYGDENLSNQQFYYKNNRLVATGLNGNRFDTCIYDQYGNISYLGWINQAAGDGYRYTYDYSRKAKQQFYMDELRRLDNGFTLLCYLGFFPELNPIHVRTHVDLGTLNGFKYWNKNIFNHQFDSEGKLIKYDVGYFTDYTEFTMTIRWKQH